MSTMIIPASAKDVTEKQLDELTPKQRMFIHHLLADPGFRWTRAARLAGYENPSQAAHALMKKKVIRTHIGAAMFRRQKKVGLDGDMLLGFLKDAILFNPAKYFTEGENGEYLISLKKLKKLPNRIGRLIESMEYVTTKKKDGSTKTLVKITLVSKTVMTGIAAKHVLVEKKEVNVNHNVVNWDDMCKPHPQARMIESTARLLGVDSIPDEEE